MKPTADDTAEWMPQVRGLSLTAIAGRLRKHSCPACLALRLAGCHSP